MHYVLPVTNVCLLIDTSDELRVSGGLEVNIEFFWIYLTHIRLTF